LVKNLTLINNNVGVYFHNSSGSNVTRSTIINSSDAIIADFGTNNSFFENRLDGGKTGINIRKQNLRAIVSNNNVSNFNYGILSEGNFSNMSFNRINNTRNFGVFFDGFSSFVFSNIIFNSSGTGIFINKNLSIVGRNELNRCNLGIQISGRNVVENNTVINSSVGIVIMQTINSSIRNNSIRFSNIGINLISASTGDVVSGNSILNGSGFFSTGVLSSLSNQSRIENNFISNFSRGIYISQNNRMIRVANNTVRSSASAFLFGTASSTNLGVVVENNDFCGNSVGVKCFESANVSTNRCSVNEGCAGVCRSC
jgi:nitrous oxidase accessory protein NosD